MADKDKTKTDEPVEEPKTDEPVEEPKTDEPVEEPKTDEPASADEGAEAAGTDQYGRQLFNVTCAACGKQTQVPFKPSGDRPVYCRDCYMQQRRGGAGRDRNRGPRR